MLAPNKVDVNDSAIAAELAAIGAELPPPVDDTAPGADAGAAPGDAPCVDWTEAAAGVVILLDKIVAPNWFLTSEEKFALTDSLAKVGVAFFPDLKMDPRLLSIVSVTFTVAAIAKARRDPLTGRVAPLRAKPAAAANEPGPETPAPADDLRTAA
jgi:hypothetical protein